MEKEETEKEILNLDANKTSQNSEFPIKIVKKNVDLFCDFVYTSFNNSVKTSKFQTCRYYHSSSKFVKNI